MNAENNPMDDFFGPEYVNDKGDTYNMATDFLDTNQEKPNNSQPKNKKDNINPENPSKYPKVTIEQTNSLFGLTPEDTPVKIKSTKKNKEEKNQNNLNQKEGLLFNEDVKKSQDTKIDTDNSNKSNAKENVAKSNTPTPQKAEPKVAPKVAPKQPASGMDFGGFMDLDINPFETNTNEQMLRFHSDANANKKLEELEKKERDNLELQANKMAAQSKIEDVIQAWAYTKGNPKQMNNLRILLSTLQDVVWSEAKWEPIPMHELVTNPQVKKGIRKWQIKLHPDKHTDQKDPEILSLIDRIYDIMNEAKKDFENSVKNQS